MKDSSNTSLSLIALAVAGLACGCLKSNSSAKVTFEAQPRPVLEMIRLTPSWDPGLEVSASGMLYMIAVYEQDGKDRVGFAMSHDGGDTFMPSVVPISDAGVSVGSHGEQSPSLTMTQTEIYALWQEPAKDGTGKIMSARSLSYGRSFEKPVQVTDKEAYSYKGFSSLGAAPNGDVYAVWLDRRNSKPNDETSSVYIAKSTDRGATFGRNVLVASDACPCCRPSLAFGTHGDVFVGWRRVFSGEIRDMVVSTSRDGGQIFSDPVRVHEDGWKLNGCADSGPVLGQLNGVLSIAWMTAGKEERSRLRFARSEDGAKSFSRPSDISGVALDPNHPAMKTGGDGTTWLTFQGRAPTTDNNWRRTQAYVVRIDSLGNFSVPEPVPGSENSITYPKVALGTGGQIILVWTQPQGDCQTVMISRGRTQM